MQSVPITTKVASLNPAHGERYSIEHYVIKFVNDLRQVGDFLPVLCNIKTDRHDITIILLKVALNIIAHSPSLNIYIVSRQKKPPRHKVRNNIT
jgi:hypothetical protein